MGIKTTVDTRGVVSEYVNGESTFNVTAKQNQFPPAGFSSGQADVTLGSTKYVFVDVTASAGCTASLPTITSTNVGTLYTVMKYSGSFGLLISGSDKINGNLNGYTVSQSYGSVQLMAISSSKAGYYWHIVSTNQISSSAFSG